MAKRFNFIIVQDAPEEPEVKRCCGSCGKFHKVFTLLREYTQVNICRDSLEAVEKNNGELCSSWELNNNLTPQDFDTDPPDVQDVEVRLRKDEKGLIKTEFMSKAGTWLAYSTMFTDGDVMKIKNISEYL